MLARDQSRIPPGRSIRFTSSPVNGAYFARQVQKSSASLFSDSLSGCAWPTQQTIMQTATNIFFMKV
jgi:hypothetical protein